MSSSFRRRSGAVGGSGSAIAGTNAGGGPVVKTPSLASLGGGSTVGGDLTESAHADADMDAQELTKDNLEIMREIVMRIRTDPDFASSIYADCPRLQHLLDRRPDLRPIFEDPNLVRINFEQVYRDAGGKLPEDEEAEAEARKNRSGFRVALSKIVNHPLFKVLRFLLLIKKVVSCITGGGVSMVRGLFQGMCCSPDAVAAAGADGPDADGAADAANGDAAHNAETKAALNKVAEHMEDPEVQAQMTDLLENDPDGLQEAIENDPELKALRDSNPLCAELMKDPDTMRILVEPDNLRALGDCPDLIEQDFADPDWTPPDVEAGGDGNAGIPGGEDVIDLDGAAPDGDVVEIDLDGDGSVDGVDADGDGQLDDAEGHADGDPAEGAGDNEEDGNVLEDYELADEGNNDDGGAARGRGGGGGAGGNKSQSRGSNQARSGFVSSVGGGFTDLLAQQVVGVGLGDLMTGFGGGAEDDMLGGLADVDDGGAAEQAAADSADQADAATSQFAAVTGAIEGTDAFLNDSYGDQLDTLEKGMDDLEQQTDAIAEAGNQGANAAATQGQLAGAAATGVAAAEGAIIGTAFAGNNENKERQLQGQGDRGVAIARDEPMVDSDDDGEPAKKSRFGWIGGLGSAIATAAKETVAGAVLGDDLGELLVEKQEEKKEQNRSKSDLNASQSDLNNRSRSDLLGGSKSDLSGSRSDMNRSRRNLPNDAAAASPKGQRSLKR